VKAYYEQIQKLVHGLQVPTIDNFLTTMFRTSLQLGENMQKYIKKVIQRATKMKIHKNNAKKYMKHVDIQLLNYMCMKCGM
jgi:hypothetical protein